MQLQLREFCAARAGDKGDTSDVTLFACSAEFFAVIQSKVTASRVQELLDPLGVGTVERYEVPGLSAIKLVIHGCLDGGAASSLRADDLGKTMGETLLRMVVEVPCHLADAAPPPRPPVSPFGVESSAVTDRGGDAVVSPTQMIITTAAGPLQLSSAVGAAPARSRDSRGRTRPASCQRESAREVAG